MLRVLVKYIAGKAVAFREDKPEVTEDGSTPHEAYGRYMALHPDPLTPTMKVVEADGVSSDPQPA